MTQNSTSSSTPSSPTSGPASDATSKPSPSETSECSLTIIPDGDALNEAVKWIVAGNVEADVVASLKHHFPTVDAAAISAAAARKVIESGKTPASFIRGLVVMGLMANHQKAAEMGDIAASTRALKLLYDIAGK